MRQVMAAVVLAVIFTFMSSAAKAQEQSGTMDEDMSDMMAGGSDMMGGGMMGGQGMYGMGMMRGGMGMMGLGPVWMLDLTPDQRAKINAIRDNLRRRDWDIMGRIMDAREKLRDLYEADKPDPKKIGPVYDAIFSLRKEMLLARIEAMNAIKDILTKEQLDQLKQWQRNRCGMYGGMMPGHMRGGMGEMMGK